MKKVLTRKSINGLISAVAQIAQSVEQGIENPRVGGSIPPPGTINSTISLQQDRKLKVS